MWLSLSWIFTLIIASTTTVLIAYMKFCSDNNVKMFEKNDYKKDLGNVNKAIEDLKADIAELKAKGE